MLKTSGRWTLLFIAAALWGCSSTPSPAPDTAAASPTPAPAAAGLERGLCSAISEGPGGRKGRFADNHSFQNLTLCAQAGARPTTLVVTAVGKDGRLDPSFEIQVLNLKPEESQELHYSGARSAPVSLYVAFLESPDADLQALLAGCKGSVDPKAPTVRKLLSSIAEWDSEDSKGMARHGDEVQPAGGSQPGTLVTENPSLDDTRWERQKPAPAEGMAVPAPVNEPAPLKARDAYDWRTDKPDQVAYGPTRHGVKIYKLR